MASGINSVKSQTKRTITFAGTTWDVRSGSGKPGPTNDVNLWSNDPQSVWVDASGALHLKIRKIGSLWYCSEVSTVGYSNYGIHRFYIDGRPDQLDKRMVFAVFLYKDDLKEIDIEFSKWNGELGNINTQYAIQPANIFNHKYNYLMTLNGTWSTHYFNWQPNSVFYKSFHGHYSDPPSQDFMIDSWMYLGSDVPKSTSQLKIIINFWMYKLTSTLNDNDAEMIVTSADIPQIRSVPEDGFLPQSFKLDQNHPNPFNPSTTISFTLPSRSLVSLRVFNPLGEEVSTVVSEEMEAGSHSRHWNASKLSSGVYFYQLQAGQFVETKKLILLK